MVRKSILYVADSVIPSRTANSVHVMKMCEAFADHGVSLTLVVPDRKAELESEAKDPFSFYQIRRVFRLKKLPWVSIRYNWMIFALMAYIYALGRPTSTLYTRFFPFALLSGCLGRRCIFESHALQLTKNSVKARIFASLVNRGRIRFLVVISKALKDAYVRTLGIDASRIVVAHDAAGLPQDGQVVNLGGREGAMQVGYVGHLYPGKGMEVIEAIAAHLPHIDFHVVGGLERDISYWKDRIPQGNVHFHGFISQSGLPAIFRSLDVGLLPNRRKVKGYPGRSGNSIDIGDFTSPLKMFEYMSYGKAILASDLEVLREVLDDGNALFADADDMEAWCMALESLQDVGVRVRIGSRAREDFFDKHTWTARARKLLIAMEIEPKEASNAGL